MWKVWKKSRQRRRNPNPDEGRYHYNAAPPYGRRCTGRTRALRGGAAE